MEKYGGVQIVDTAQVPFGVVSLLKSDKVDGRADLVVA